MATRSKGGGEKKMPSNKFRRVVWKLVHSIPFQAVILLLIITNTVILMIQEPNRTNVDVGWLVVDRLFVGLFTVEALLKIIALGVNFNNPHSYFRDSWNCLDFLLIATDYIMLAVGGGTNLMALRSLRGLRPLRSVKRIKILRITTTAVMESLPLIAPVLLFLGIGFMCLSAIFFTAFRTTYHQRCILTGVSTSLFNDFVEKNRLCSLDDSYGRTCSPGYTCMGGQQAISDYVNWDRISTAMLTKFRLLTQEDWNKLIYWSQDTGGTGVWLWYFFAVISGFWMMRMVMVEMLSKFRQACAAIFLDESGKTAIIKGVLVETKYEKLLKDLKNSPTYLGKPLFRVFEEYQVTTESVVGHELVEWVLRHGHSDDEKSKARKIVGELLDANLLMSTYGKNENVFANYNLYAWASEDPTSMVPATVNEFREKVRERVLRKKKLRDKRKAKSEKQKSGAWTSKINFARGSRLGSQRSSADVGDFQGKEPAKKGAEEVAESTVTVKDPAGAREKEEETSYGGCLGICSKEKDEYHPNRLVRVCAALLTKEWFVRLIMVTIVLNTIVMCTKHNGQAQWVTDLQFFSNLLFMVIYTIELFVRFFGMPPPLFWLDGLTVFDNLVTVAGIIDLIITLYLGRSASAGAAVRVLRVLRVLRTVRVFRLLRYFTRLEPILRVIKLSLASLGWIVFLMFLLMTVYAIIGMHLFGNKVEFTSTPHSFNTYPEALFVGFSILIGRYWTPLMLDTMVQTSSAAFIYFISNYVIFTMALSNIVLCVLMERFKTLFAEKKKRLSANANGSSRASSNRPAKLETANEPLPPVQKTAVASSKTPDGVSRKSSRANKIVLSRLQPGYGSLASPSKKQLPPMPPPPVLPTPAPPDEGRGTKVHPLAATKSTYHSMFHNTAETRKKRLFRYLDTAMTFFIVVNCVIIAVEGQTDHQLDFTERIASKPHWYVLGWVFFCIFATEIALKCWGWGFLRNKQQKRAFLNSSWNILDLVIVATAFLNLLPLNLIDVQVAVSFQACRALRPLRMMNKSRGMRVALAALRRSLPYVLMVVSLLVLVVVVFAAAGVTLFSGRMYRCNDPAVARTALRATCEDGSTFINKVGIVTKREWVNAEYNFDNVLEAMYTLSQVWSSRVWMSIYTDTVWAPDLMDEPSFIATTYYVVYLLIADVFFTKVFLVVIFSNFVKERQLQQGITALSPIQQKWVNNEIRIMTLTYTPSIQPPYFVGDTCWKQIRIWAFKLSFRLPAYRWIMLLMGVANAFIWMLGPYYPGDMAVQDFVECSNFGFLALFWLEIALLLAGGGFVALWASKWNTLSLLLVLWGTLELATPSPLYVWRVFGLLRIIRESAILCDLLSRLRFASYLFGNITLIYLFVVFVFMILSVDLYGYMERPQDPPGSIFAIMAYTDRINYRSFNDAFQTALRVATKDAWDKIMMAMITGECNHPNCSHHTWSPRLFFPLELVVVNFFFIHLFAVAVMEYFFQLRTFGGSGVVVTQQDLRQLRQVWKRYDFEGKGLNIAQLYRVLLRTPPPLGLELADASKSINSPERVNHRRSVTALLRSLDLPASRIGRIPFTQFFRALVYNVGGAPVPATVLAMKKVFANVSKTEKNPLPRVLFWIALLTLLFFVGNFTQCGKTTVLEECNRPSGEDKRALAPLRILY